MALRFFKKNDVSHMPLCLSFMEQQHEEFEQCKTAKCGQNNVMLRPHEFAHEIIV